MTIGHLGGKIFMCMNNIGYNIILASNSPRRKELLAGLGVEFDVRLIDGIDETYPSDIESHDVAEYIAKKKADAYRQSIASNELIITADTIVILGDEIFGKPLNADDAYAMLQKLSGKTHQVITGVCLLTKNEQRVFRVTTDVTFKELELEEIKYYVDNYKPFDKAGAYGIQEWIGYIGVTSLNGSYFNVVGFPVQRIYTELQKFASSNM